MQKVVARSQVGGKYSQRNSSLFRVKDILGKKNVEIRHPIGDRLYETPDRMVAFDPELCGRTFYEIEIDYYGCLRDCDFHVVANELQGAPGYIGSSAGIEIGYCMLHDRPLVFLSAPSISATVGEPIRSLIERNLPTVEIVALETLEEKGSEWLRSLAERKVLYSMSIAEEAEVTRQVADLFAKIVD